MAISIEPKNAALYLNRGIAKANLHDYQGAIQDFTIVTELDPNNGEVYYNMGIFKYNLNNKKDACLDWQKASAMGFAGVHKVLQKYCR